MNKAIDIFFKYLRDIFVDFDGYYGDQCVDLVQQYNKVVVGGTFLHGQSAKDIFTTYPRDYYEKIINKPDNKPYPGDIVIWGDQYGPSGHIAICIAATLASFTAFSQNDPENARAIVREYSNYYGVLGWLHPKKLAINLDMTEQEKKDVESMQKLRAYNGVWYEAQDIIRFFEQTKKDCQVSKEALNSTISKLRIDLTTANREIDNRKEQVERLIRTYDGKIETLNKNIEGLKKIVEQSETGASTYLDQIKTLEAQLDNEAKEKGKALLLLANEQAKNIELQKKINEQVAIDYKTLPLKERLKICLDILI